MISRSRSVSLIDGGWLEHARRGLVPPERWSLQNFAERIVPDHHWRFRTYYFDALPFKSRNNPSMSEIDDHERKDQELKAVGRLERFTVRRGYCAQRTVFGKSFVGGRWENSRMTTIEQKMVDVLLATELTRIAWSKEAEHISLVGGDGDYVAAVEAAKDAGSIVRLYFIRTPRTSVASTLFDVADERVDLRTIFAEMVENANAPTKTV